MATDLPWSIDEGQTHWEDCYRERWHHNCAVVEVDRLRAENKRLREALKLCMEDLDAWASEYERYPETEIAIAAAREALEATDDD